MTLGRDRRHGGRDGGAAVSKHDELGWKALAVMFLAAVMFVRGRRFVAAPRPIHAPERLGQRSGLGMGMGVMMQPPAVGVGVRVGLGCLKRTGHRGVTARQPARDQQDEARDDADWAAAAEHRPSIAVSSPPAAPADAPRSTRTRESRRAVSCLASRTWADRSPCFHAFRRLRAFPSWVLGPVEASHGLTRLADALREASPSGLSL